MHKVILMSLLCLIINADATKRSRLHRKFQGFVEKQTSTNGETNYGVGSAFAMYYKQLLKDEHYDEINCVVAEVNARKQALELRQKNSRDFANRKLKSGGIALGLGTLLVGLGMYNVQDTDNNSTFTQKMCVGLSWATLFFGAQRFYAGLRSIDKAMNFEYIINGQLAKEIALSDALGAPYFDGSGSESEED